MLPLGAGVREYPHAPISRIYDATRKESGCNRWKIEPRVRGGPTYTSGFVYNFLQLRGFRNTSPLGYPESILQSALIVDGT